jgi:hypothetical protein
MRRCQGIKRDGNRCSFHGRHGGYCGVHEFYDSSCDDPNSERSIATRAREVLARHARELLELDVIRFRTLNDKIGLTEGEFKRLSENSRGTILSNASLSVKHVYRIYKLEEKLKACENKLERCERELGRRENWHEDESGLSDTLSELTMVGDEE